MRMNEQMTLGRWMKRLRADLDLTQEALAQQVGCAVQTIRTFEIGKRRPSRELAERLADVLQVPQEQRVDFIRAARTLAGSPSEHPGVRERDRLRLGEGRAQQADATNNSQPVSGPGATKGQATLEQVPLLATKLYIPRPRVGLVSRSRLLARLEAGVSGPVTVIAAPAGFGKTTVLADWLSQPAATSRHVAWLALDAGDSDPHQFLRYLIAALQTIAPAIGGTTLTLLRSGQAPPIGMLLPFLLNDLTQLPERSILVLDDYHVVDGPAVHQALAFLLDHLPPQLHLLLASRADPPLALARLRARGQLTELRAHDLRFTADEAATFLREVMGLALSVEDVAALEARTEGWIAGLQLAALSLRDRPDVQQAAFIEAFTGSNRFVVDYLVGEVLARQPPHLQIFLLQTSIFERLCGSLCDAVVLGDVSETQHTSNAAQRAYSQVLLEELERSNLFIVPLDETRRWYRYHQLFAQVLRERLISDASQDAVANLHCRASIWFEQHGLLSEALQHVFAAEDWGRAARLLEQHAEPMMMRGEFLTLRRWVQVLPQDVARKHPHLLLAHAWAQFLAEPLQADAVEAILRDAEAVLGLSERMPAEQAVEPLALDRGSAELRGKLAAIRASVAGSQQDVPRTIALAQEALTYLPQDNLFWRIIPTVDRGLALTAAGAAVAASQAFTGAIELCRMAGHSYGAMIATMHLARVRTMQGQLHAAAELHQRALHMAAEQGWGQLPMVGLPHVWLGKLLYEWNDLEAATRHLLAGIKLARLGEQRVLLEGYAALARVKQAQGDVADVLDLMQSAEEVALTSTAPWAAPLVRTYQARLWLAQGQLERAGRCVEDAGLDTDDQLVSERELEYVTLARVQIAGGRSAEVLPTLDRLLQAAEAAGRLGSMIEMLALQAVALLALGDTTRALTALQRALLLAAPAGYVRLFVDEGAPMAALLSAVQDAGTVPNYVVTLRAAFPTSTALPVSTDAATSLLFPVPTLPSYKRDVSDTLTERELEVLRLLAAGYSNQTIAHELVVAVGTVKRHVSNIASKLGVQSRLQAVARARKLGLV
jgi:LuxR family transcriptional regulator, maltose regulon positive regulatory protein